MTYEELSQLPVLNSVIRETFRLNPPIHSLIRYVRLDVPVPPTLAAPSKEGTYVVPRGHYLVASPNASQVDPQIWSNPNTWDPTRWSDPEGVAAQAFKSYSDENSEKVDYGFGAVSKGTDSPYQPFGGGRHRCIGERVSHDHPLSWLLLNCSLLSSRTCNWGPFLQRCCAMWSLGWIKPCQRTVIM